MLGEQYGALLRLGLSVKLQKCFVDYETSIGMQVSNS